MSPKVRCHACRKRHRGCFWSNDNPNGCIRCTRLKIECIPYKHDYTNEKDLLPRERNRKQIEYWQNQIAQLSNDIQQFESAIQLAGNRISIAKKRKQLEQQVEWSLTIDEDGLLKLNTDIESMQELLLYSQAFVKYISPLNGLFNKSSISFQSTSFHLIISAFHLILYEKEKKRLCMGDNIYYSRLSSIQQQQHSYYRSIMDHLIKLYVNRKNSRRLLVHIPTFIQHYNDLEDPLTCPVTLAICVHTVCTARHVIKYSATERRQLADFFYDKCKDILFEIFDDPSRKLETLTTINILQHFVIFVLLRMTEARRFATIAYALCKDLEMDISRGKYPEEANCPPQILRVLFQRHFFYAESTLIMLDYMIDKCHTKSSVSVTYLDTMPDEDERNQHFIEMHNYLLELCTCPYMGALTRGKMAENSKECEEWEEGSVLEVILRLDHIIRDWWSDLPPHLRLCDNLYAVNAMEMTKRNTSVVKAVIFSFVHSILLKMWIYLLSVSPDTYTTSMKLSDNDKRLLCRETQFNTSIRSCELLLSTMTRLFHLHDDIVPSTTFEFMARAVYTLLSVSFSPNIQFPNHIQQMFDECFAAISAVFPVDNIVPASLSPLNSFVITQDPNNLDIYKSYPFPGYALIADILNACHTYLQSHFDKGPGESLSIELMSLTYAALYGNFFCFME
ncbi:hypothetical protein BDA99DRAFT_511354 [Phascolomyces articulosus]|uniref:Zn(2)-C6 fungal-type domain-containing protein n=1 Tax=Phascolomyces articulosus TaxID=60185 RepID=A0AAD5KC20_9FUNG|nr:hypothetical protein BDA99DRAFT_511354 [Phascolomyces articulosus]